MSDEAINAAISLLRANGYSVSAPISGTNPETPGELQARLGISTAHFARTIARPECPGFWSKRGEKRIITMRSNPQLDAFLTAYRK